MKHIPMNKYKTQKQEKDKNNWALNWSLQFFLLCSLQSLSWILFFFCFFVFFSLGDDPLISYDVYFFYNWNLG